MTKQINLTRESSFELIRILAQFFIVYYHIFCFFIYPTTQNPFHKAIWLPLHIGVILFVLISGYFGIKTSVKGFISLIGKMVILYLPLAIIDILIFRDFQYGIFKLSDIKLLFFISGNPFWYMRAYIALYLLAPLINKYFENITFLNRIYIIVVLGFLSHYVGTIGLEPSLIDGKNAVTFLFLYSIGNTLKYYKEKWTRINKKWYGISYIILNVCLVLIFSLYNNRIMDALFNRLVFSYCSFGLLISSLLFFMWIGGMNLKSKLINSIAKSSLTIYIIHGSNLVFFRLLGPIVIQFLDKYQPNTFIIMLYVLVVTTIIVFGCIIIDKMLEPIWHLFSKIGFIIQEKLNKRISIYV